jgi:YbbR domain-containing protein
MRWKLLSLGLAFLFWMVGVNLNNPSATMQFHRFLKISNADALTRDNIVILNERELFAEQIRIGIRAPQSELALLDTRTDNIEVSIDLRHINPDAVKEQIEETGKPVIVAMDVFADILENDAYERMYIRPRTVDVELDKYIRQMHEVQVILDGNIKAGHELISVECVNKTVTVIGAKSRVEKVASVAGHVDITELDRDRDQTVRLAAYDRDGNELTNVDLSVRETQVHINVMPYKTVTLAVGWTGTLAFNHIITAIRITPEEIDIAGPLDFLETLNTLHLETLDLTGVNTTQTFAIDIAHALPDARLSLRNGPADAAVIVVIEPMRSREFSFPVTEIGILGFPAGAVQLINNESIRFNVIGSETDMAALTRGQIRVSVDLTGLHEGEHAVPLTVNLPPGIDLIGEPPHMVLLLTTPDPDEPVEMPEDVPPEEPPADDDTVTVGSESIDDNIDEEIEENIGEGIEIEEPDEE